MNRAKFLLMMSGNAPQIYGVSWDKTASPTLTRTGAGVGMVANAGMDAGVVDHNFNSALIYKDISEVTDVLVNADCLINMPLMKNQVLAGVTLGFKHHFGGTNSPIGMHANVSLGGTGYCSDYNALVDLYTNLQIGPKTILTLADGLVCVEDTPEWESFTLEQLWWTAAR